MKSTGTSMFSVRCWMLNVAVIASAGSALAAVRYADVDGASKASTSYPKPCGSAVCEYFAG